MSENSSSLLGKIAVYTEILSKDSQSTVFVSLCEAYRQLGMLDDALEIAEKGTVRLPGFSPGFTALGRINAQRGDLAEAVLAFERALTIEKDNALALKGLARVRYRQGYRDKARALLEQVLVQNPNDPIALKMLASLGGVNTPSVSTGGPVPSPKADLTVRSGVSAVDSQRRRSDSKEPANHLPSAPIPTETVADLYRKQGLLGEAATIYRALLRENPHNENLRQKLVALKQQMDGVAIADDAPAPRTDNSPLTSDLLTDKAIPEPADLPIPDEPPRPVTEVPVAQGAVEAGVPQDLPPEDRVLMHLDRWLNAIDKRRAAHVQ